MQDNRSTLVYVTGKGRISEAPEQKARPAGDGIVRISLRRLGGSKIVSVVSGVPLGEAELTALCRELKQKCGTGGTLKNWNLEIQGDKRSVLQIELERRGFKVKLAGG
ncbi:MAG: stress response translation initiation inhibitor YciH [Fibrobacteraceae bacterium]